MLIYLNVWIYLEAIICLGIFNVSRSGNMFLNENMLTSVNIFRRGIFRSLDSLAMIIIVIIIIIFSCNFVYII